MEVGLAGTIAEEVYFDVQDEIEPCCAEHCGNEIFRPALAYKGLFSLQLQGIGGNQFTQLWLN